MSNTTCSDSDAVRYSGRVKWFNNKTGFGFISVTSGDKSGLDLFVHHSSIVVDGQQYKYLVQGEYVEFDISDAESSGHQFQAANVKGIDSGKLMCETRNEVREARENYRSTVSERQPARRQHARPRGGGPRETKEWSVVKDKKNKKSSDKNDESVSDN